MEANRRVAPNSVQARSDPRKRSVLNISATSQRCPSPGSEDERTDLGARAPGLSVATYYALQIDTFDKDADPIVEKLSRHDSIVVDSMEAHLVPPGYYDIYYDKDVYVGHDNWVCEFALRRGCGACVGKKNPITLSAWIKEFRDLVVASDAK